MGKPDFREGQVEKWGQNWKILIFPGKSGAIVVILPWKDKSPPFYTFLTQIILHFI